MRPGKPITRFGVFNLSGFLLDMYYSAKSARVGRDWLIERHRRDFYVQKVEIIPIPRKKRKPR